MPEDLILKLVVNGEPVRRLVPAHRTLLELLREDLRLTGTKHGCDLGDCGACTVLVDGVPRLACVTVAAEVDGCAVRTVEDLALDGQLDRVQAAMHRHVASQCGYCTPGIAMKLTAVMEETNGAPDDAALKEALASNICRCTGYTKLLAAAREAVYGADDRSGEG